MTYSFNQRTAKVSFDDWCAQNGIEVVDAWDTGMYGNIGYKVRKDGVEYEASAYQSTGMSQNFTFDLFISEE